MIVDQSLFFESVSFLKQKEVQKSSIHAYRLGCSPNEQLPALEGQQSNSEAPQLDEYKFPLL